MDEGYAYRARGNLKGALRSFEGAHKLMGVPSTGLAVAETQRDLGLLLESITTALEVSRSPAEPTEPEALKRARAAADKLVRELEARLASLSITVTGGGARADWSVFIDGTLVPHEALEVPRRLNPGPHTVALVLGDHQQRETVELREGEARGIRLNAAPLIALVAEDEAKKRDEERQAAAAQAPTQPTGAPERQRPPPQAPSPWTHPVSIGGLVTLGVGVGVGAVAGVIAFAKKPELEDSCADGVCPPEYHDTLRDARTAALISNVGFGVALAGAGATALGVLVFSGPDSAERPPPGQSVSVRVLLGVGSASVIGRFQ
jgi:hypothetical protein